MKKTLLILTAALALTGTAVAEDTPDFTALLKKIDVQSNFKGDASATVTIRAKRPGEKDNISQAKYFRRDQDDKFLILILKPDVNKGQGYLKIGDNIIFYDPESRKFSKMTGSSNFQDSNAKNSDFEASSLATDYTVTESARVDLGGQAAWALTLKAKNDNVTYATRKVWISVDGDLLLRSEDYSKAEPPTLMRTSTYDKYIEVKDDQGNKQMVATRMKFENNLKKGEVTDLVLTDMSLAALPNSVFSQAYLEKVNK